MISCYTTGTKIFNTETFQLETNPLTNFLQGSQSTTVFKDSKEKVWMGISNVGLLLWNINKPERLVVAVADYLL